MNISTHCIHGRNEKTDKNGAVSFPIYQTATFAHPAVGISTGYDYSRLQNPTREELEKTVALLEGLLMIVDNTFLTPYFQQPIKLGADIVVHSGTKYLSGHNDTLAGFLVTASEELSDKLRFIYKTVGSCLSPFDSWLLMRGIKTLAVRMDKHNQNALKVAAWLKTKKKVKHVFFVGLESHPGYEISKNQSSGFGGMISFEVDTEETAVNILERVKLIKFAESLGGVESLITYPMLQTHTDVPKEEREAKGINERLLRLSVGIESCQDIIDDLDYAIGG